jgi:hypothetical protein
MLDLFWTKKKLQGDFLLASFERKKKFKETSCWILFSNDVDKKNKKTSWLDSMLDFEFQFMFVLTKKTF